GQGVVITGPGTTGNIVLSNTIGSPTLGALGNTFYGVLIADADNNVIGSPGAANFIYSNGNGVGIFNGANNKVQHNEIGTNAFGIDGGNLDAGIVLGRGAHNNLIGGTDPFAGNIIGFNRGTGVRVESGIGNAILSNSIYRNSALGIDLGPSGVTTNDPIHSFDADTGANNLQNFPVVTSALGGSATTTIGGFLDSAPSRMYRVEFFSSNPSDPSGFGEGGAFLGYTVVNTGKAGLVHFTAMFPVATFPGQFITATATNLATNDTSEF